jgi:hypothetical protein
MYTMNKTDINIRKSGKTFVKKVKKCTANKGDYSCTIWGSPWCDECALYK